MKDHAGYEDQPLASLKLDLRQLAEYPQTKHLQEEHQLT
jgi:hypothetical protein